MQNIKGVVRHAYEFIVVGNQKAIVGFASPLILGFLLLGGITQDMTVKEAVDVLVIGIVTSISVWFKANKN